MYHRVVIGLCACLLGALAPGVTWGCSFCPPDPGPSLLKQLDSASAAVLAELISAPQPDSTSPVSRYRISLVLKGDKRIEPGDIIDVPLNVQSPLGSVHLFFSGGETVKWRNPLGVSPQARHFLQLASKLPTVDDDSSLEVRCQRLAFMLPYLISQDSQIARSAYGEFAAAPNAAVKQLKPILNHRMLMAWIELEAPSAQNRRLLFTLLGVCRHREDLPFVKAALDDRLASNKLGELDAIIATYLTLAGSAGLDEIDRRLLRPADIPLAARRAAVGALRFHVDNETVIEKKRGIASCRLLLDDPKSADYVIGDFARWEDWDSLDAILALRSEVAQNRWLKQPILSYLESCPLPAAQSALAAILQSNP